MSWLAKTLSLDSELVDPPSAVSVANMRCLSPHRNGGPVGVEKPRGRSAMLCWGNASFGQLGLGGIDEEIVVEPRKCEFFHGKKVCDVGCGRRHTAFLIEDGTVYTCGCNDLGQLGHEKSRKKPGKRTYICTYIFLKSPMRALGKKHLVTMVRLTFGLCVVFFFSSIRAGCGPGCTDHSGSVMWRGPHTCTE